MHLVPALNSLPAYTIWCQYCSKFWCCGQNKLIIKWCNSCLRWKTRYPWAIYLCLVTIVVFNNYTFVCYYVYGFPGFIFTLLVMGDMYIQGIIYFCKCL